MQQRFFHYLPDSVGNDGTEIINQPKKLIKSPRKSTPGAFSLNRVQIPRLNLFDAGGNIKYYQWMRPGLEVKGIQLGLAVNFDE